MTGAVLDTNVLASGFATAVGPSGRLLDPWRAGPFELIVSDYLLAELARTFEKRYFVRRMGARRGTTALVLLRSAARLTPLSVEVQGVATHPEDDPVLATALSGHAG